MPSVSTIQAAIDKALLAESTAAANVFTSGPNVRAYACRVCSRPAYAAGLCNAHYIRQRAGKPLEPPIRARKRDDRCTQCGERAGAKGGWGLCARHYKAKRYKAIKQAVVSLFGGKCSKCETRFPLAVFDFHHVRDKEDAPSSLFMNASAAAIAKEVAKCVLICANCHRIEHSVRI